MSKFGKCSNCDVDLEPVYFTEDEYETTFNGVQYKTGRKRRAVSHLVCPACFVHVTVDDSFDSPWR